MKVFIKLASRYISRPDVQKKILVLGKKTIEMIKDHGENIVENVVHIFGI